MNEMKTIRMKNNREIPILGLGTWQQTGPTCTEVVKKALDMGYTHVDTAEIYGNEAEVGEGIKDAERSKLFITSKLWMTHYAKDDVLTACNDSLERLGTDYLDLYLMHWPRSDLNMKETLDGLKELYDQGKVKAVGVSNFTINHLKEILPYAQEIGLPITMNQVEFHPLLYQKELLEFCKEHDITVTAYSPLARGEVLENETLKRIAEKHDVSAAQIALAWLMHHGMVVIPKATSEKHLQSNLDSVEIALSSEEMDAIDGIDEQKRLIDPDFAEFDH